MFYNVQNAGYNTNTSEVSKAEFEVEKLKVSITDLILWNIYVFPQTPSENML